MYVLGIDVGGTRLKTGAVGRDGALLASGVQPSGYGLEPEQLVAAIVAEARRCAAELDAPAAAVAMGFSGAVEPTQGVVLLPGKIKGLEGYPIVPRVAEALGVPVVADNDGRLSILAERYYGQAQDVKWAVTITLGTGVGSGVMLDGHILRDPHLQFGTQMSHIVQDAAGGRLCITGARGTANILCAATTLGMMVRDSLQRGLPSVLNDRYAADPHSIDFKAAIEGVAQGDRICLDALARWTDNLGWFLVSTVHAYAPERIILSGGATNAAEHFLPQVQQHVNEHVFRYPKGEPVPIVLSELRDHAGVLGAAALAWQQVDRAT